MKFVPSTMVSFRIPPTQTSCQHLSILPAVGAIRQRTQQQARRIGEWAASTIRTGSPATPHLEMARAQSTPRGPRRNFGYGSVSTRAVLSASQISAAVMILNRFGHVDIAINGVVAIDAVPVNRGAIPQHVDYCPISAKARQAIKSNAENVIAIDYRRNAERQMIDFGRMAYRTADQRHLHAMPTIAPGSPPDGVNPMLQLPLAVKVDPVDR